MDDMNPWEPPAIAQARGQEMDRRMICLSKWAASRAAGDHDPETTVTMLRRKAKEAEEALLRVTQQAWSKYESEKTITQQSNAGK